MKTSWTVRAAPWLFTIALFVDLGSGLHRFQDPGVLSAAANGYREGDCRDTGRRFIATR